MRTRNLTLILLFLLALGWIGHTLTSNLVLDVHDTKIISQKDWTGIQTAVWLPVLYTHIVAASVAVLTGPFGFSQKLRAKSPRWHRRNGTIYVLAVLIAAATALYLSFFADGGAVSIIGFLVLNGLWFTATWRSVTMIKHRDWNGHRSWMIRSYALSLANTSLHIWLMIGDTALGLDYITAYQFAIWICWAGNLSVAEWIIRRGRSRKSVPLHA